MSVRHLSAKRFDTCVFIGCGEMGGAMLEGWLAASMLEASRVSAVVRTEQRCEALTQQYGITCHTSIDAIEEAVDLAFLAVTPGVMFDVIAELADNEAFSRTLFVSIAAGLSTEALADALPQSSRLVRTMPNLPLQVRAGATVLCPARTASEEDITLVKELFDALGEAWIIEETMMDAVCALSGSGPGYVAAMIEALTKAGEEQGLPRELSYSLAIQTVYGSSLYLKETGRSAKELMKEMTRIEGTTWAALNEMKTSGLDSVYSNGVAAAVRRSKELAQCNQ